MNEPDDIMNGHDFTHEKTILGETVHDDNIKKQSFEEFKREVYERQPQQPFGTFASIKQTIPQEPAPYKPIQPHEPIPFEPVKPRKPALYDSVKLHEPNLYEPIKPHEPVLYETVKPYESAPYEHVKPYEPALFEPVTPHEAVSYASTTASEAVVREPASYESTDTYKAAAVGSDAEQSQQQPSHDQIMSGQTLYTPPARESFYKETIKNTPPKKQSRISFKQMLALVCIGGSCIGFMIGASSTIVKDYIMPRLTDKQESSTENLPAIESDIFKEQISSAPELAEHVESADAFNSNSSPIIMSFADIINKVEPSVVCVTSTLSQESGDIFNFDFGSIGNASVGFASGILFYESDAKYYIVTNNHVVQGANNVTVSISGSGPINANLVGSDPNNDLAVISISKEDVRRSNIDNVTIAKFGNSDNMNVGDVVLAIGNALGEGNIATNGIVSAKDKTISVKNIELTVLQTNAAINPGNSGGPLVNLKGEVIGINTAKISEASTEGMGYSIPSSIAQPIIQGFMDSLNKPFMGVTIQTLTSEQAKQFNLPMAGAIVETVAKDSPAEKAKIQPMDIITGFDGDPILTSDQLVEAVRNRAIGETVEVKLIRNGKENITVKVKLEQRQ